MICLLLITLMLALKKIQGVLEKKQRRCRTTEAKHMAIGKVQSILTYVQPLP